MSEAEAFVDAPSQESLDVCTREQLLWIADHYKVVVEGDKRFKENIKDAIMSKLIERGIMSEGEDSGPVYTAVSF